MSILIPAMTPEDQDTASEGQKDSYWSGRLGVKQQSTPAPAWRQAVQSSASAAPVRQPPHGAPTDRRIVGVVAAIALFLVGAGVGVSLVLSSKQPLLSPPAAQQAFKATWPQFDAAYHQADLAKMEQYATSETVFAAIGEIQCGCGPLPEQRSSVELSVPVEYKYPLSFLAQIAVTQQFDQHFAYVGVFTKPAPTARWRLSYLVDYSGKSRYLTSSEFEAPPVPPFNTDVIGGQVAAFFQSYANTGVPPTSTPALVLDGSTAQEVENLMSVKQSIESEGDTQGSMTIAPTDHSTRFAYPGGDILCGALHSSVQITTPPNEPTVQPLDRSNWGPTLLPGSYASLEKQQVHDYCMTVSTKGRVVPVSYFGGTYSIVGNST
jgi:hypothetical protein